MSHGAVRLSEEDISKIVNAEGLKLPKIHILCLYLFILIGVLAFAQEYIAGGASRKHAWMALHVNFIYWFGMTAAASGFTAVFHICNAQWVRPIRRIFESASSFFLIAPIFIILISFGASDLFIWVDHPVHGKEIWLQKGFVYTRDFIGACLLVFILSRAVRKSLFLDIVAIKENLTSNLGATAKTRWNSAEFSSYIGDGVSAPKRIRAVYDSMGRIAPVCVMAYAFIMSLIAFDLLMSVDPHWYSTMFGGFYFMSSVYSAVAFVCITTYFAHSYSPLLQSAIKLKTLHDLGKLLLGFGIFWAYLFWSHYLPIWYANLPEETGYMILRLRVHPWRNLAWLVLGLCFIVPFLLGLSRDIKQIPALLASTALIVQIGLWLQYYLLFAPSLYADMIPLNFTDIGIGMGFFGLLGLMSLSFLAKYPLVPFGDILMDQSD